MTYRISQRYYVKKDKWQQNTFRCMLTDKLGNIEDTIRTLRLKQKDIKTFCKIDAFFVIFTIVYGILAYYTKKFGFIIASVIADILVSYFLCLLLTSCFKPKLWKFFYDVISVVIEIMYVATMIVAVLINLLCHKLKIDILYKHFGAVMLALYLAVSSSGISILFFYKKEDALKKILGTRFDVWFLLWCFIMGSAIVIFRLCIKVASSEMLEWISKEESKEIFEKIHIPAYILLILAMLIIGFFGFDADMYTQFNYVAGIVVLGGTVKDYMSK